MKELFDANGRKTPRAFKTVCRRTFREADPQYFPKARYCGRVIYFCAEACLRAFLSDSEAFYKAHAGLKNERMEH